MLNRFTFPNCPLHFGQFKLYFLMIAFMSLSDCLSGTFSPVLSVIYLSALKVEPHLVHLMIGSVKLSICPEATKTLLLIIWEPSISIIPSRLTTSFLHRSMNLFFILTPIGPYSQ